MISTFCMNRSLYFLPLRWNAACTWSFPLKLIKTLNQINFFLLMVKPLQNKTKSFTKSNNKLVEWLTKINLNPHSNVNKKCDTFFKASHLSLNNIWIIPSYVVSITSGLLFLAHVRIIFESCLNQVKVKLVIIALVIAMLFSIFEGMRSSSVFQISSLI